jgi:hypothetical protein
MQERSEEQIISRLLELENDEQAERRVRLRGEKYLSLLHDPDDGRSYILRHGTDETEGAEIPEDTEFYEYPTADVAQRAFQQMVKESRRAGQGWRRTPRTTSVTSRPAGPRSATSTPTWTRTS